jgi:hypothetical protein
VPYRIDRTIRVPAGELAVTASGAIVVTLLATVVVIETLMLLETEGFA